MAALSADALLEVFGYAAGLGDAHDVRWLLTARAVSTDWREAARLGIEREWAAERARTAAGGFTLRLLPPLAEWRKTHGANDALALSRLYRAITTVRSVFELHMEELRKSVTLYFQQTRRYGAWTAVWYCMFQYDPPWAFSEYREQVRLVVKGLAPEPHRQLSVMTSHRASGGLVVGPEARQGYQYDERSHTFRPACFKDATLPLAGGTGYEYHVPVGVVAAGPPLSINEIPKDTVWGSLRMVEAMKKLPECAPMSVEVCLWLE